MTREKIEARKAELEEARLRTLAQLNAIVGALNDCDYWLAELAKAQPQETP